MHTPICQSQSAKRLIKRCLVQIDGRKARASKAGRSQKRGRHQGKPYKPLTVGTVKYAVFNVLSQAGPAGLTIKEIVAQIKVREFASVLTCF